MATYSRTRRMASPGLRARGALLRTFSTSSSIAWRRHGGGGSNHMEEHAVAWMINKATLG